MDEETTATLRDLLFGPLVDGRHVDITDRFHRLGLPEPEAERILSKADRARLVLSTLSEEDLHRVADAVLRTENVSPSLRNSIQDILWNGLGPIIWERTRRSIAAALDEAIGIEDLVVDSARFEAMLDRWSILGDRDPFEGFFGNDETSALAFAFGPGRTPAQLRKLIQKHVFNNPGDWSAEKLFDELGAFTATNRRFAQFIEDLVSHDVVIHEENQLRLVAAINPVLAQTGLELRETTVDNGYPVFEIIATGSPQGRPKNVIFGSPHKPDLRISDTIDHDIEIFDPRGNLVFDDPIGPSGLRWSDLQTWWQRVHPEPLDVDAAKKTLYNRLRGSLPAESPPQQLLFDLYHKINRTQMPSLPALLPEVWLHWDPKTIRQRGADDALLSQRMDFLLLAPSHIRIILEVDGATHYTDQHNQPSPARYAQNARYDRDMQLRGYTVYRFGAAELASEDQATPMLETFFTQMFAKHRIG